MRVTGRMGEGWSYMGGALKEEPERSPSEVWGLNLNGGWVSGM